MEFEYKQTSIGKLEVVMRPVEPVRVKDRSMDGYVVHGGRTVDAILVDGEPIRPTNRFWSSLYARFNLNSAFFKFFDHAEVFSRIAEKESNDKIRLCIERKPDAAPSLLAATGLNRPILIYDDLMDILEKFKVTDKDVRYDKGIVRSTHDPRIGGTMDFKIAGDDFRNKFELHAPIDGYGAPNLFLSLLRLICSNGAVGYAQAFRTTLQLGQGGDSTRFALMRALDGFTNEEGYAAMRERFDIAANSWASVHEQQSLYNLLIRLPESSEKGTGTSILRSYEDLTGRPSEIYHRDPNMFSDKKQRTLPVSCKVYDVINFATELSTHNVSEHSSRVLDAWVGELISNDYDLEDSADHFGDWREFFLRENQTKFASASRAREATEDDSKQ